MPRINDQLNETLLSTLVKEKRRSNGLSLRDAATNAGVAFSTLSRLERMSGTKPDLETLERVAAWLGVSPGTLFASSEPVEAHLRARKKMSSATASALRDLIIAARTQYRVEPQLRSEVERDADDDDDDDAKSGSRTHWEETARGIRSSLRLGEDERLDPFTIAIPRVVRVDVADIHEISDSTRSHLLGPGSTEWSAATIPLWDAKADWLIVLNDSHNDQRRRATLMEEYCHILLGHDMTQISAQEGVAFRDYKKTQETEAYYVGAATLVPEAGLRRRLSTRETAERIAEHYGVSRELVEFRIKRIGLWYLYQLGVTRGP